MRYLHYVIIAILSVGLNKPAIAEYTTEDTELLCTDVNGVIVSINVSISDIPNPNYPFEMYGNMVIASPPAEDSLQAAMENFFAPMMAVLEKPKNIVQAYGSGRVLGQKTNNLAVKIDRMSGDFVIVRLNESHNTILDVYFQGTCSKSPQKIF